MPTDLLLGIIGEIHFIKKMTYGLTVVNIHNKCDLIIVLFCRVTYGKGSKPQKS